jgi:hypothetical protein
MSYLQRMYLCNGFLCVTQVIGVCIFTDIDLI